jgi:hypothetical protein
MSAMQQVPQRRQGVLDVSDKGASGLDAGMEMLVWRDIELPAPPIHLRLP